MVGQNVSRRGQNSRGSFVCVALVRIVCVGHVYIYILLMACRTDCSPSKECTRKNRR